MTPTSGTGPDPWGRRAGLTLVELMVVLLVLGVAATAVVMTMPDPRPGLGHEAEVFAARLVRAREEAILTNRTVEAAVDADGYAFRVRRPGRREPLATPPFEPVQWSAAVQTRGAETVAFDPTGGTEPAQIVLVRDEARARVTVDTGGEVRVHVG
ncbi:GspH/FimT family protein [Brevundimonas sp.]|uniref:GspH/FimT family protein n=1 Tax=Brevundimonas sp. TaxID=1871086 RepID=UPI0025CF6B32|nr:GspH/FimT family protein [Brevundimonas sp.]